MAREEPLGSAARGNCMSATTRWQGVILRAFQELRRRFRDVQPTKRLNGQRRGDVGQIVAERGFESAERQKHIAAIKRGI